MEESAATASSSILSIWASINSWFTPTVLFLLLNLMIGTILFTSNLPTNQQHKDKDKDNKSQNQNDPNQPKLLRSPSILHRLKSLNFYPNTYPQISSQYQQQQQALEIAATEYVFNQSLPHHQDAQPNPTRLDQEVAAAAQYADFAQTHEVELPHSETHFVFEHQQTVETVTAHFDLDPTRIENPQDTGFEETHEEENDEFQSLDEVYSKLTGAHVNRTKSDTEPASGELPPKLPAKMKKSASLKSAFSHFEEEKILEVRRPATVRERKSVAEEDDVEVDAKADDFINKFKHQLKLQRIDSIIRYKDMINRGTEK